VTLSFSPILSAVKIILEGNTSVHTSLAVRRSSDRTPVKLGQTRRIYPFEKEMLRGILKGFYKYAFLSEKRSLLGNWN
jgi:hypothetical protein